MTKLSKCCTGKLASELVEEIQALIAKHGDLPIVTQDDPDENLFCAEGCASQVTYLDAGVIIAGSKKLRNPGFLIFC